MNQIVLIGRIGKDAETFKSQSGTSIITFSLATGETYRDKNGEKHESTEWHTCKMFDKEHIAPYLTKGVKLAVVGKMHYETYEKNGEKRYVSQVIVRSIEFCESKQTQETGEREQMANQLRTAERMSREQGSEESIQEDDLPW